jgi:photosystem II stability/assembly factor-like uncharacterized protein
MHRPLPAIALALALQATVATASPVPEQRDIGSGDMYLARIPATFVEAAPSSAPAGRLRVGWHLQQTVNKVLMGVSFADPLHGYACAELGGVYRTTNGGQTWTTVMNVGFPYYWYGVQAFSPLTAVVAGFQNQTGAGIIRWTFDGGATWTADVVLDPANWLLNIRFADDSHGIAYGYQGYVYVTQNGGRTAPDWTKIQADPTAGWFAGNFDFHPDGRAWLTGISLCGSTDFGVTWSRRGSADAVFDGGVSFSDALHGWTGGGQISSPIMGWVHKTTDGGLTWSGRLTQPSYPIRIVKFFDDRFGFAAGGTRFGNAGGGIWLTTDAGVSWTLDADTGAEMSAIDTQDVSMDSTDVWCVGFLPNFNGVIYKKRIARHVPADAGEPPIAAGSPGVAPNPFAGRVFIAGDGSHAGVFDPAGRLIRTLDAEGGRFVWDGRDESGRLVPSGIYLVRPDGSRSKIRVVRIG